MAPVAALWLQRGVPVLHAAVAARDGHAVVIAGDSAMGKSTLLAALLGQGWNMLSEDLAAISFDVSGTAVAHPAFPELHLWPDACEELGFDHPTQVGCARFDLVGRLVEVPTPVSAIWWLDTHNHPRVAVEATQGAARFDAFARLAYNSRIAEALLDRAAFTRVASASTAGRIPLCRLIRPRSGWSVAELSEVVAGEPSSL